MPDSHHVSTEPPITGRRLSQGSWRFLTGQVEELPGSAQSYSIEAEGYTDFLGRSTLPDEIESADASNLSAELRLPRTYLHGDTSSTLDVSVYDLTEEAEMNRATADTTFPAESEPILSTTVSPTDSLVTLDLPAQWISEHLDVLQNTEEDGDAFTENFHGFKLTAPQGEVVVGFSSTETTLRLVHEPDSVMADFQGIKSFTHVRTSNSVSSPSNEHLLLQDGIGRGFAMSWDFDDPALDTLENAPLNRAEIYIPIDSTELAASTNNPHFVRPPVQGFRIIATRTSNAPSCSSVGALALSDTTCVLPLIPQAAPNAARVGNDTAFPIFEESLLNEPVFSKYRVQIADRDSTNIQPSQTINPGLPSVLPVLVPKPNSPEDGPVTGPRAILTVTEL